MVSRQNMLLYVCGKRLTQEEETLISHLASIERIEYTEKKPLNSATAFVDEDRHVYVDTTGMDLQKEIERLEKNIEKIVKEKEWHVKKLSDEKFLSHAAQDVIEETRQKLAEAESRLKVLQQILGDLR